MSQLIVTKLNEKLERVNCAYCGSFDYRILFRGKDRIQNKRGEYPVVQCKRCGLIYLNPRPNIHYLIDYYYKGYFGHKPVIILDERQDTRKKRVFEFLRNKTLAAHFGYYHLTKSNLFWKTFTASLIEYFCIQLMPTYQNNGKLLEVGCSYGMRLERLRDLGWDDVMGVELGVEAAKIAKSRGLNVICMPIEKVNFEENAFKVIIASMVIEHISNPFLVFKKFERWLKPGGQLLFSIPNIEGLEYRVFRKYWYSLHIPYHLYFFSDKFIKKVFTNFDVTVHYQKAERDIIASLKYFVDENTKYKSLGILLKLPRVMYKMIEGLLSQMGRTSRISVYAIKK